MGLRTSLGRARIAIVIRGERPANSQSTTATSISKCTLHITERELSSILFPGSMAPNNYSVRLYPPFGHSFLYKEYHLTRFNHQKSITQPLQNLRLHFENGTVLVAWPTPGQQVGPWAQA